MPKGLLDIQSLYPELSVPARQREEAQIRQMQDPWQRVVAKSNLYGGGAMRQGLAQAFNNRGILNKDENWEMEMRRLDPSNPDQANEILRSAITKYRPEMAPALMAAEENLRQQQELEAERRRRIAAEEEERRYSRARDQQRDTIEAEERERERAKEEEEKAERLQQATTIITSTFAEDAAENMAKYGINMSRSDALKDPVTAIAVMQTQQQLTAAAGKNIELQMENQARATSKQAIEKLIDNGTIRTDAMRYPHNAALQQAKARLEAGDLSAYSLYLASLEAEDESRRAQLEAAAKASGGNGVKISDGDSAKYVENVVNGVAANLLNGPEGRALNKSLRGEGDTNDNSIYTAYRAHAMFAVDLLAANGIHPGSPDVQSLLQAYTVGQGSLEATQNLNSYIAAFQARTRGVLATDLNTSAFQPPQDDGVVNVTPAMLNPPAGAGAVPPGEWRMKGVGPASPAPVATPARQAQGGRRQNASAQRPSISPEQAQAMMAEAQRLQTLAEGMQGGGAAARRRQELLTEAGRLRREAVQAVPRQTSRQRNR